VSDQQALLDLLARFGISGEVDAGDDGASVTLEAHHGGVLGYVGFVCQFEFDQAGSFTSVGVWE
jgi:hypothetical protein